MEIPERTALSDEFGTDVSESIYRDYYRPMFFHLNSLDDSEMTSQSELYEKVTKDVDDDRKEDRLKCILHYNPTLIESIVDAPPTANTFVTYCANRLGLERSEIDAETLNEVQQECERADDEMRDRYRDYHVERLRDETEQNADIKVPDQGHISASDHRKVMREFTELVSEELPDELTSFDQRMTKIGGNANELIAIETLLSAGLERTTVFADVSSNSKDDIRVYTTAENGNSLYVEVKSKAMRERTDAGAARIGNSVAIFSFFDDATEVKNKADTLREDAIVTYLPPATITEIRDIDSDVYELRNGSGGLFFRANNTFPEDMKQYYRTGDLPERGVGHERAYIE